MEVWRCDGSGVYSEEAILSDKMAHPDLSNAAEPRAVKNLRGSAIGPPLWTRRVNPSSQLQPVTSHQIQHHGFK
jgi:hypothetical protein